MVSPCSRFLQGQTHNEGVFDTHHGDVFVLLPGYPACQPYPNPGYYILFNVFRGIPGGSRGPRPFNAKFTKIGRITCLQTGHELQDLCFEAGEANIKVSPASSL